MFRSIVLGAFLALFAVQAHAAEIQILAPPVVANAGLKEIAAAFTRKTGIAVATRSLELLRIGADVTAQPTDIVFLTTSLMDGLAKANTVKPDSVTAVGRVNVGLAVRAGAAQPDISTAPKLIAALGACKGVVYSNPDPARGSLGAILIDRLLKRPEFSGVHGVISSKGNGASGLINGEGDCALQFESEILPHKEIALVGALPPELGAYVDISVAVPQNAAADAPAFIKFITAAQNASLWVAGGLSPASP